MLLYESQAIPVVEGSVVLTFEANAHLGSLLVVSEVGTDAMLLRHDGWDPVDRDEVLTRIDLELRNVGAELSWLTGGEETSYVLLALGIPMGATLEQGWSDVVRLLNKEREMKVRVITQADVALAQRVWNDELD